MIRPFRFLTVAVAVAMLLGGSSADAQGRGPDRGPGRFGTRGAGLPLRALNLTDSQREQVREVIQQHREQTRTLTERLRAAQQARRQAVEAMPADENLIRAAIQELAMVEADLAIHRTRVRSEVFAILTPEQQAQAQKLRADREARLKQRQDRMRQRGGRRPQA